MGWNSDGNLGRVDLEDLDDAGDLLGLGVVEAHDLAAVDGRAGDEGVEHPVEAGVDAVHRLADGEVVVVDEADLALADVAEGLLLLQRDALAGRHRQLGGGGRDLAVAEAALRLGVGDDVVLGLHLAGRHAPLLGGGLDQHGAGRGAGVAQVREEVAERARAVGVLVAEAGLVTPGLGDLHLRPVGVELVGHHQGDRGAHALAHLGAVAGHRHGAVRRRWRRTPSGRPASHAAWHRRRTSWARPSCPRPGPDRARRGRARGRPCRRAWRGG